MEQDPKQENVEQDSDTKEQAFTHLAQGKRHLLVKDYNEATTSLSVACTLLSKLYGELANECGEAYFNYGKALLELARTENGVLGIEGERDESEESDENEGDDEKEDNPADESKDIENGKNEDENKEKELEVDPKTEDETKDKASSSENQEEEEGDDVDNLHLAWEMLEMAKIVFRRQAEENKQMHLKLAEVHLKLGEVSLESENYSQGIEEIKTCLNIQLNNLDKHDRYIAETHYQLGMAYTLNSEFDNAIEQYTHALNVLQKRMEYLQEREKQGITNEQENKNNPFYSIKEEIAEINALLPEVKEKISDVQDYKKDTVKALLAGLSAKKEEHGENSGTGQETSMTSSSSAGTAFPLSSQSTTKPVSDISHLVRKKRKLETDSSEDKSSKQPCPDVSKPE